MGPDLPPSSYLNFPCLYICASIRVCVCGSRLLVVRALLRARRFAQYSALRGSASTERRGRSAWPSVSCSPLILIQPILVSALMEHSQLELYWFNVLILPNALKHVPIKSNFISSQTPPPSCSLLHRGSTLFLRVVFVYSSQRL